MPAAPKDRTYDVAIAGGGIAGSALAIELARGGLRVAVVERTEAFADRVRGEWLAPWGVADARHLGLIPTFEAAGARRVPWNVSRSGKLRYHSTPQGDVPLTFSHPTLQQTLLDAAETAGAEVIRPASVESARGGALPELTVRSRSGGALRLPARLLVGADGRSSSFRAMLGRSEHEHRSERLLAGVRVKNLRGREDTSYFLIGAGGGGLAMLYPQGDGAGRAYALLPGASSTFRQGGFEGFVEFAMRLGIPHDVIGDARQDGPLGAFVASDSWIERPYENGVAVIGDAAGVSDPTWGMGIALALRDARALGGAIVASGAPRQAAASWALERDRYFEVIRTVENWQSNLLLTPGDAADQRRRRAAAGWSADPSRVPDLNGLGPELPVDDAVRARFFGEDHEPAGSRPLLVAS